MFSKKRIICLLLSALMLVSLTACKANDSGSNSANLPTNGTGDNQQSSNNAEEVKLTGKLNLIKLKDRDSSILRGVRIIGQSIDMEEAINGKESSLTDVRCIFEMSEWVDIYPDMDAKHSLRVWILKHRDDQDYYNTAEFSDLDPNFVTYCDLYYPSDSDNPDEWYWGSFYLHPEECEPGYYDFVFTYEEKAIAVLVTRFYGTGEIEGKSSAELEALMGE